MNCGRGLAVSYPVGVVDKLRQRGKRFEGERGIPDPTAHDLDVPRRARPVPSAPLPPPPTVATDVLGHRVSTQAATQAATQAQGYLPEEGFGTDGTVVDGTEVAPEHFASDDFERTVASARSPYGELAGNIPEPEAQLNVGPAENEPTQRYANTGGRDMRGTPAKGAPPTEVTERHERPPVAEQPKKGKKRGVLGCLGGFGTMGCGGLALLGFLGIGGATGAYYYYSKDLPTIEALKEYTPATVTTVHAKDGRLLGEIYEQRRYVRPLSELPEHVRMAFVSAEDATFYEHGGVNYMGILRAVGRSVLAGGKSPKGTSTITQQVAKNFLLTNEHSITRKIKEALLAWRIEDAYDKDHILFLYLNEIYLGSQAYGVEAASRTYFGKSADELSHGEAALLAGLPPRPSGYSPHRSWKLAKQRQEYVLKQMVEKGHLTEAEGKAALEESITIIPRGNTFLEQAPHFTEHARRFLVDRYGEEKVLNEGLSVTTTCDLDLQKVGQNAVTNRIFEVDQRMGFRRDALEATLSSEAEIDKVRKEHELAMRKVQAAKIDAAKGRRPLPKKSTLEPGKVYKAVVLEVEKSWLKIGIGDHEAIIPIGWSTWAYQPNPKRSWRRRSQDDFTTTYDWDDDGKKDASVLKRGDVILSKVVSLSTQSADDDLAKDLKKVFKKTPGAEKAFVAARLWQVPVVEGALLSMDLHTGAVITMVGGADFRRSQLNRTLQSRRQVGSTFKPIVYAAAIESKKVTSATMIPDAPMAKATTTNFVWKPGNYGNDYLGNITLRKALAMSRNTCTVRVLEATDPRMENDIIWEFGRRLGIGGIPTYRLPPDHKITPETDQLCPWVEVDLDHGCKDSVPKTAETKLCRSCDMSMALGSASITMEEMVRAYSAFATGGTLIEPFYISEVKDRDGAVLYAHEVKEPPRVLEPEVAAITTWLLQNVVQGGTAARANRLGLRALAGKTGTTNDEKDAWFIGFTNDVISTVWVGFDQPAPLGVSSTGGRTALPIWMDFMKVAAPKDKDRPFPMWGNVQSALIDEATGRRVDSGGRAYPFLPGTVPESSGIAAGQLTVDDLMTEL